jgi:hypothetical protein
MESQRQMNLKGEEVKTKKNETDFTKQNPGFEEFY